MGKVVEGDFPARCTFGEEEPAKVLADASRAKLECVAVVGISEDGAYHFAYSENWSEAEVHFLLSKAAHAVLTGEE